MHVIDGAVKNFMKMKFENNVANEKDNSIDLYFEMQMTENYKEEEKLLQNITSRNIAPKDNNKKIRLKIYYKNKKLRQQFIKNGVSSTKEDNNVVYQYTCSYAGCHSSTYIGYTTNLLTQRMKQHFYSGSIREHHH